MNSQPQWVLAPFVAERLVEGRLVLRATGPGRAESRKAVPVTDAVRRVATALGAPASLGELPRRVPEEDEPTVLGVAHGLIDAGLVVLPETAVMPVPSIELEITNRCNADCVMCPRHRLRPLGNMTEDVFERVVHLLEGGRIRGVVLQGIGEPTLHPRLGDWVARIRRALGTAPPLVLVTNWFRLSVERMGCLIDAGIGHVQWSFHSLEAARYDRIMGATAYERVIRNLEDCAGRYGDFMSINMVVMDCNRDEVDRVRHWMTSLGLARGRLRTIPVFSRGGYVDVSEFVSLTRRPSAAHCLYSFKSLFIAWNGDVLPCSNDIEGHHAYANVAENDAEEVLERWFEMARRPVSFEMCRACDHHSRDCYPTDWFQRACPRVPRSEA
jgi:radical SAM protein with 4Fe4S-binding SPASM domain